MFGGLSESVGMVVKFMGLSQSICNIMKNTFSIVTSPGLNQ